MFTAFMLAITLTTVANVLVSMAIGPADHRPVQPPVPAAPAAGPNLAGDCGGWRGHRLDVRKEAKSGLSLAGTLVALAVPLAAALNFTMLQHVGRRQGEPANGGARTCCRRC
jgi:hypothetical protein